jgi:hypothetical protein
MTKLDVWAAGIVLAVLVFSIPQSPLPARAQAASTMATGTYESQELVIANYKSALFAERLKVLKAQCEDARRQGDTERVRQFEKEGGALQDRAHKQLAGEAPITEILEALRPHFPEVAKAAGVGAIVSDFVWKDPSFKTVDLTDRLVQKLAPSK